eukprot:TRINITY_DN2264_c0_g2_i3.p1 TRINITY_DN2264_c0_g2~~TRINITY_DN2264_c0_g2_i3.p1  ORF type:complete len:731 (+),score=147.00 TRINITY_DN2264_c0_g2_i3:273-2465(+)
MSFRKPQLNKPFRTASGTTRRKDPLTRGKLSGASKGLLEQLRKWDKASRNERVRILENFIAKHSHTTGAQLQTEYGNGASLFLARISAWLRLTYLLGFAISQQLRAISIFVGASSGQRFLLEFLETGGVATVLEILTLEKLGEGDKQQCLTLLTHVASSGRNYKELVCEHEGIKIILETLAFSYDDDTQACCKNLILPLGRGNPMYQSILQQGLLATLKTYSNPGAQRIAAQSLRVLYRDIPFTKECLEPTLALFKSLDIQVQHEGFELIKLLASDPQLSVSVVTRIVELLTPSSHVGVDEMDDVMVVASSAGAATQHGHFVTRGKTIPAGYIQQACAARALGVLITLSYELAQMSIELDCLTGLFQAMANTSHYESQKAAGGTLHTLVRVLPDVEDMALSHMGEEFFHEFMDKPATIYRDLNVQKLDILRWGAENATSKAMAPVAALAEDAEEQFERDEHKAALEQEAGEHGAASDDGDGSVDGEGSATVAADGELAVDIGGLALETEAGDGTLDNVEAAEAGSGAEDGGDEGLPEAGLDDSLYTPFAQAPTSDKVAAFQKVADNDGDMTESNLKYIKKTLERGESMMSTADGELNDEDLGTSIDGPLHASPYIEDVGSVPAQFPFRGRTGPGSNPASDDGHTDDIVAPLGAGVDNIAVPDLSARNRRQSVIDAAIAGGPGPNPAAWGGAARPRRGALPDIHQSDDDEEDEEDEALAGVHAFLDMSDDD